MCELDAIAEIYRRHKIRTERDVRLLTVEQKIRMGIDIALADSISTLSNPLIPAAPGLQIEQTDAARIAVPEAPSIFAFNKNENKGQSVAVLQHEDTKFVPVQPATAKQLLDLLRDLGVTSYCNPRTGVVKVIVNPFHRQKVEAMGIDSKHPLLLWVDLEESLNLNR
jgi:hypothetical protein